MAYYRKKKKTADAIENPERWQHDPVGYIHTVLGMKLTDDQKRICELTQIPPYRILVRSGHGCGKTALTAALTSWRYDAFHENSGTITTAPSHRDVIDLLWREVRTQRTRAGLASDLVGATSPELRQEGNDGRWAKGYSTARGESFSGRHPDHLAILFDEATGIDSIFWTTAGTMWKAGNPKHLWIAIFNPLDTTCEAYRQEDKGSWHVVSMSCLNHPNVTAGLAGTPADQVPFPGAVDLPQVNGYFEDMCDPVGDLEQEATDIEWPPGSGKMWRPSPNFQCRVLGEWPTGETMGVWSRYAWQRATGEPLPIPDDMGLLPQIGVDPASYGVDSTVIHTRWHCTSIHHESHQGWTGKRIADRLKDWCAELAARVNQRRPHDARQIKPQDIPVRVECDGGYANSILEERDDFFWKPLSASGRPVFKPDVFRNRRSENWFYAAGLARKGLLSLSLLPSDVRKRLENQLLAVSYHNVDGYDCVESKDDMRKKIGRSPDDADAMLIAYAPDGTMASRAWELQASALSHIPAPMSAVAESRRIVSPFYGDHDVVRGHRRHWSFGR